MTQVLDKLSPTIAQAVQNALRGSSDFGTSAPSYGSNNGNVGVSYEPVQEQPARYDYKYSVANPGTQTYISQEESRDGLEVVGKYSYVDPTGAIVTVRWAGIFVIKYGLMLYHSYTAGVNGYQETRDRQEGAVRIVDQPQQPQQPTSSAFQPGLNSEAIIQQVLAALQPAIQQSVNNAVNRG